MGAEAADMGSGVAYYEQNEHVEDGEPIEGHHVTDGAEAEVAPRRLVNGHEHGGHDEAAARAELRGHGGVDEDGGDACGARGGEMRLAERGEGQRGRGTRGVGEGWGVLADLR